MSYDSKRLSTKAELRARMLAENNRPTNAAQAEKVATYLAKMLHGPARKRELAKSAIFDHWRQKGWVK